MMNQQQMDKCIVSKGEYVRQLSKKAGLSTATIACIVLLGVSLLALLGSLFMMPIALLAWKATEAFLFYLLCFFLSASTTGLFAWLGYQSARRAKRIDTGIPLTRANTADLPAPGSLVRASAEPVQEQQAMLLRAAAQAPETPSEQLLRSSENLHD